MEPFIPPAFRTAMFKNLHVCLTKGYMPDNADRRVADIKKHEVEGEGYRSKALENVRLRVRGDRIVLYADDVSWDKCSIEADGCWLYTSDGHLVCYWPLPEENGTSLHVCKKAQFDIEWPKDGIMVL